MTGPQPRPAWVEARRVGGRKRLLGDVDGIQADQCQTGNVARGRRTMNEISGTAPALVVGAGRPGEGLPGLRRLR